MEEFAGITTPFVKNKTKGEKIMSKEERHLQTKIRMFEDILLRTRLLQILSDKEESDASHRDR